MPQSSTKLAIELWDTYNNNIGQRIRRRAFALTGELCEGSSVDCMSKYEVKES